MRAMCSVCVCVCVAGHTLEHTPNVCTHLPCSLERKYLQRGVKYLPVPVRQCSSVAVAYNMCAIRDTGVVVGIMQEISLHAKTHTHTQTLGCNDIISGYLSLRCGLCAAKAVELLKASDRHNSHCHK